MLNGSLFKGCTAGKLLVCKMFLSTILNESISSTDLHSDCHFWQNPYIAIGKCRDKSYITAADVQSLVTTPPSLLKQLNLPLSIVEDFGLWS